MTDNTQQEIAQALAGLEPMVDVKVEYVDVPDYPGKSMAFFFKRDLAFMQSAGIIKHVGSDKTGHWEVVK